MVVGGWSLARHADLLGAGEARCTLLPLGTRACKNVLAFRSDERQRFMRSANDIHPGAIVAGKYRVRAILGRNHGLTIDAFHTSFDQRAIIKLLLPNQAAAQEIERFRRESRALSKIASEHVARILDVGNEPDGSLYLI